ncbi:hypothetical protein QAD02_012542 [Eretmocerus hayati]|uniref:Uncharacterized protein n=1 Tax=Eretmocerus hayati TaxID=131215 RepID=A0ACC2P4S3_9HYME|nr:hypothetical protein QAD02_012542 [Eretmocerus hayati]
MKQMLDFLNRPATLREPRVETVRTFWKSFSIADSIDIVAESWAEIQESTLKGSWNKLWPENSGNVVSGLSLEQAIPELVATAVQIGGEGFSDMRDAEILELVRPQSKDLSPEEIEAMMEEPQNTNEVDDEETSSEETLTAKAVAEVLNHFHAGVDKALAIDPIMNRSLRLKHEIEQVIRPYEEIYKDLVRRTRQSQVTEFFEKKAT